jgi:hypothetical protein
MFTGSLPGELTPSHTEPAGYHPEVSFGPLPGATMAEALGAAPGGPFMSTKPEAARCRTSRSAVMRAIIESACRTRFRPSYCSAKDRASAISSGLAGERAGGSGMPGRIGPDAEHSKNFGARGTAETAATRSARRTAMRTPGFARIASVEDPAR